MKVLVIKTVDYWRDGLTRVVLNLVQHFKNPDLVVDSVVIGEPTEEYRLAFEKRNGKVFVIKRSIKHPVRYVKTLTALIKKGRYDAVHAHGNSRTLALEMLAAKKAGCKIRIAHCHNTSCKHRIAHRLLSPFFFSTYTLGLACSSEAGKWLFGKKQFKIVNNAIDADKYRFNLKTRNNIRHNYRIEDGEIVLGQIGILSERKNPMFSLEILKKILDSAPEKRYRLLFIGDGELRDLVLKTAEDYGLSNNVIVTGYIDNVYDYLNAVDVALMPSLSEGLPLSAIEFQANGLNCILSDSISKEVDLSNSVSFLSLNNNSLWCERIFSFIRSFKTDRTKKSENNIISIRAKGYDIALEASKIEGLYFDL